MAVVSGDLVSWARCFAVFSITKEGCGVTRGEAWNGEGEGASRHRRGFGMTLMGLVAGLGMMGLPLCPPAVCWSGEES